MENKFEIRDFISAMDKSDWFLTDKDTEKISEHIAKFNAEYHKQIPAPDFDKEVHNYRLVWRGTEEEMYEQFERIEE